MSTTSAGSRSDPAAIDVLEAVGQMPLGAGGAPALDRAFSHLQRTMLDDASWVDHVPGWITGSYALFGDVAQSGGWAQRSRRMYAQTFREPRLTAEFPSIAAAPVPFMREIADALQQQYGVIYDSVWMNFYRDEADGTGWHADRPANRPEEAIVPVLSLGAPRRFLIKPKDGGKSVVFTPQTGDLLVMGGRAQRDWIHAAPKQKRPSGPRISLNFGSSGQNGAEAGR